MMGTEKEFEDFQPRTYLAEFFGGGGKDPSERELLRGLVNEYAFAHPGDALLELGGGPSIYQLISAAPKVESIVFTEYLPENLEEVRAWLRDEPTAWDWDGFIAEALVLEGRSASAQDLAERKAMIRRKVKSVLPCDITRANPLDDDTLLGRFDALALNYVIDSITNGLDTWREYLHNAARLLKPQALLVYNAIADVSEGWQCRDRMFPGTDVQPEQLREELAALGFSIRYLEKKKLAHCVGHGAHLFCAATRARA